MSGSIRNVPEHAATVRAVWFDDLPCDDGSTVSGSLSMHEWRVWGDPKREQRFIVLKARYSGSERREPARTWQYSGRRLAQVERDWRLFLDPLAEAATRGGSLTGDVF